MKDRSEILEVPYVEARLQGGKQRPSLILIELTNTTSAKGAALGYANYLHASSASGFSCHYVVDETQIIRCVDDKKEAVLEPPLRSGVLSIRMCGEIQSNGELNEVSYALVLEQTQQLVASLTLQYNIRPRVLSEDKLRKWSKWPSRRRGGICFKIPGAFSPEAFMRQVSLTANQLT